MKAFNTVFPGRFGFCAALLAAFVMTGALFQANAADDGDWELIFTDTFDREELGENWEVVGGSWKIDDGALVGSGTLISSRGFPGRDPDRTLPGTTPPGFIRLEFKARTDVQAPAFSFGAPPKATVSDLSSFIHAEPYEGKTVPTHTGYFFQFGGFMNTRNMICRAGKVVAEEKDPNIRITADTLHHVVVENDEGMLRLIVDGQTVFEQEEKSHIMGQGFDRIGFYFSTRTRVESVRVLTKRLTDAYF